MVFPYSAVDFYACQFPTWGLELGKKKNQGHDVSAKTQSKYWYVASSNPTRYQDVLEKCP